MHLNIPADIRAEIVRNYMKGIKKEFFFLGSHKRNAYEDILSISEDDGSIKVELSKQGLYDILPEALFHPIDRFDNIPANEYKERFAEEIEQQKTEEANARFFFSLYDKFIFDLSSVVSQIKDTELNDNNILIDILCDSMSNAYKSNRFISRTKEFIPRCNSIRGNETLITLMLRKIMSDEGIKLNKCLKPNRFEDECPRYNFLIQTELYTEDFYLGNSYDENILQYDIQYWNDDYCDESFLKFIEEIKVFEDFVNDYFMGIETSIHFNISKHTLPVRISDSLCFNYLDYNTNL